MSTNTGWQNPSTVANLDRDSKTGSWVTPANTTSKNNTFSTVSITAAADYSDWIRASNFGLVVPSGAIVTGVEVRVWVFGAGSSVTDDAVRLVDEAGVVGSQDRALKRTIVSKQGQASYLTFGNSTDLWGDAFTLVNIEDADFGFVFSAGNKHASAAQTASVDHMQIRVWYTEGIKANWNRRAKVTLSKNAIALGSHQNMIFQLSQDSFPAEALDADGSNNMESDGKDLRVSLDVNGVKQLPIAIERVSLDNNPVNSNISVFIKVPIVSSGEDFVFYVWYDNASAVLPTNSKDVWDDWMLVHYHSGNPTSLPHAEPDRGPFGFNVSIVRAGASATITRQNSTAYRGGYGHDVNSTDSTNGFYGTYTGLTGQSFTHGNVKQALTYCGVFVGRVIDNLATASFNIVPAPEAAAEGNMSMTIGSDQPTPVVANISNFGDGAPTGSYTSSNAVVAVGHALPASGYNQAVAASLPGAVNTNLALFTQIKGAAAYSIYGNGQVLGNCLDYVAANIESLNIGVYPTTVAYRLWNDAPTGVANVGADIIADFTGILRVPVSLEWHTTLYNQWVNQSAHTTVAAPTGTVAIKTLTINGLIAGQSEIRLRDGSVTLPNGSVNPVATATQVLTFPEAIPTNDVKLAITTSGYEYLVETITLGSVDIVINLTLIPDPSWVP